MINGELTLRNLSDQELFEWEKIVKTGGLLKIKKGLEFFVIEAQFSTDGELRLQLIQKLRGGAKVARRPHKSDGESSSLSPATKARHGRR